MPRAVVCFADDGGGFWARLLRRGFRHVFVLVEVQDGLWARLDPRQGRIVLWAGETEEDAAKFYREHGYTVAEVPIVPIDSFPPGPFTCVTAVKRVIGLRARFVWTPWALYRHLRKPKRRAF